MITKPTAVEILLNFLRLWRRKPEKLCFDRVQPCRRYAVSNQLNRRHWTSWPRLDKQQVVICIWPVIGMLLSESALLKVSNQLHCRHWASYKKTNEQIVAICKRQQVQFWNSISQRFSNIKIDAMGRGSLARLALLDISNGFDIVGHGVWILLILLFSTHFTMRLVSVHILQTLLTWIKRCADNNKIFDLFLRN